MKIALAGAGAFGEKHLDGLKNIDGVEVVSLVGRELDKTQAIAAKYGIGHATTDLADSLAMPEVDAVILCTPTQMHAEQAIACMDAGKHVEVEIPLADSWADAEAVMKKQQETGLVCMVGHTRRFNPSHQWVHNRIKAGEINIQQMDVQTYFFRRTNMNAKGEPRSWTDHLLWHHAAHTVDLFAYQAGPIVKANAIEGPIHPTLGIAMDMSIQLKAESGAICTLSLSFNNDGPLGTFFRYICDNGTYLARYDDLFTGKDEQIDVSKVDVSMNGIELQDREFIAAIREGREPNSSVAKVLPCYKVLGDLENNWPVADRHASVGIIGAGPAGLMLGLALQAEGIDAVVVERQSADYVLSRIRAGILERTTTDLLRRIGVADRLDAEGVPHDAFNLADGDRLIHIDCTGLTGHHVTAYGQTEVTRDLIDAADARGLQVIWSSPVTAIHGIENGEVQLTHGEGDTITCDFVIGCDGFHGPSRQAIPAGVQRIYERAYPFGWLGVLADVPPCRHEVIYACHDHGFALASMRSPTRSRYYVQVPLDERIEDWSDDRFWDELKLRLGPQAQGDVVTGPSIEKSIAPLRSFVSEPMRHGRLFLAGDAAHIVPPTGAKGLNLASSDVAYLSEALIAFYKRGDEAALNGYAARALARVWKSSRFSWYLTKLMHRFPEDGPFERHMQRAELDYIAGSEAMRTTLAENYVGLPL